jgi:hypothetical protein
MAFLDSPRGRRQHEIMLVREFESVGEPTNRRIEQYDDQVHWRCRQLGGEVTFRYCRKLSDGLPCARIVSCWHTVFDVRPFLERHYDPEQLAAAWNQPRPDKMAQLAEMIHRARMRSS